MARKKTVILLLIILSAGLLVVLLWNRTLLLSLFLVLLAFIKHKMSAIRNEFTWFIVTARIGTLMESIVILSGAWNYADTQVLNFPLWLPFLWGLTGTTGVSLYQQLLNSRI